jgi:membrane protease YdiL (CAAX protease family)
MRRALMTAPQQRPLSIFLFFLCLFSGCTYVLDVHSHRLTLTLAQFIVWCPGSAAVCTCLLLRIPLGTLGWSWPVPRFLRLAYFLPLLYATPVYLLTWLVVPGAFTLKSFEASMVEPYGLARWPAFGTFGVALPLLFTVGVVFEAAWSLGEELGWRGFLFPRLQQRFGFHGACIISGAIWAAWHVPELLWTDFNPGTNPVFFLACFTVMVTAFAYIMGYLRLRSGSLWPCVLLHATHNTFIQGMFDPLTANVGWAKYISTEFGVGLALAMVVAATVMGLTGRPAKALPLGSTDEVQ